MRLEFIVNDLMIIAAEGCKKVVDDSINYVECHFTFLGDFWQNKVKTAVFSEINPFVDAEPVGYTVILTGDTCVVPTEVLKGQKFTVGLTTAYIENGITKTVYTLPCIVPTLPSCFTENIGTPTLTPSQYDQITAALAEKVDKVEGKGLSEADFTTAEKEKLATVETGAQENVINGIIVNGSSVVPSEKIVALTVPTAVSQLQNDSGFIASSTYNVDIGALQGEDLSLQQQIDGLAASSDVVDIVGTYTELQNYDTSTIHNNDIVKVLSDSTHNDAISYYRWVITDQVGAWTYIGSQGPYVTAAEVQQDLAGKMGIISGGVTGNLPVITPTGSLADSGNPPSAYAAAAPSGSAYIRSVRVTGAEIAVADWTSDNTFIDYPYRAAVTVAGTTTADYANVFFAASDVALGILAPYTNTGSNVVYIYSSEAPATAITIQLIEVIKV